MKRNPHIDTVVASYYYGSLSSGLDEVNFSNAKINNKFKYHFFLFSISDYIEIFRNNPKDVVLSTPKAIFYNVNMIFKGYSNLGGYLRIYESKLDEQMRVDLEDGPISNEYHVSDFEAKYLDMIYRLCEEESVTLVLLNTPIHSASKHRRTDFEETYFSYAKDNLPEALLVNHMDFSLPDSFFYDAVHLNAQGAEAYSNFLAKNRFTSALN